MRLSPSLGSRARHGFPRLPCAGALGCLDDDVLRVILGGRRLVSLPLLCCVIMLLFLCYSFYVFFSNVFMFIVVLLDSLYVYCRLVSALVSLLKLIFLFLYVYVICLMLLLWYFSSEGDAWRRRLPRRSETWRLEANPLQRLLIPARVCEQKHPSREEDPWEN